VVASRTKIDFGSSDEFLQRVSELIARLDALGQPDAAAELRDGLRCLNGLTDGWALFLESIERVQAAHASRFAAEDRNALDTIRAAARKALYRR
jgi:hypothetical protein